MGFGFQAPVTLAEFAPTNQTDAIYQAIQLLLSAGWTKIVDSDGTTQSTSGVQVTHGGSGANGYANNNAYIVVKQPGANRCWGIQRVTSSTWTVKVSRALMDVGGSASVMPSTTSADDIGTILSSAQWFQAGTNPTKYCGRADTYYPYGFYFCTPQGGNGHAFMMDPFLGADLADDPDPYAFYVDAVSTAWTRARLAGASGTAPFTFYPAAAGGVGAVRVQLTTYNRESASEFVVPHESGYDADGTTVLLIPGLYARDDSVAPAIYGCRGYSSLMLWVSAPTGSLAIPGIMSTSPGPSRDWIRPGSGASVVLPWTGDNFTGSTDYSARIMTPGVPAPLLSSTVGTAAGAATVSGISEQATDSTVPTVSNISPVAGTAVPRNQAFQFDVTDETGFAVVAVYASFANGDCDVVYDGGRYRGRYSDSDVFPITDGYRFTVTRRGGWPGSPTLEFQVVDSSANMGVIDA